MTSRQAVRVLAALAAAVAAIVLGTRSFTTTTEIFDIDGSNQSLDTRCENPVHIAFSRRSDGGWFAYAPNTGVTFSTNAPSCTTPARVRVGIAGALLVGAIALLAIPPLRGRRSPTGE